MVYVMFVMWGFFAVQFFLFKQVKERYIRRELFRFYVGIAAFSFVGAKLMGVLTMFLRGQILSFYDIILYGDMVYYGGLYGAIVGGNILLWKPFKNLSGFRNYMCISIPLFHAISRCGCYFAGCCYGVEICGYRVPVQLIEAFLEFIIFAHLCYCKRRNISHLLTRYFLVYGVVRFFDEFLRGDMSRGFVGVLSVGQVLSLIHIVVSLIYLIYKER